MKKFKLIWNIADLTTKSGKKEEIIEGISIADAFAKAGYGGGALAALDFWAEMPNEVLKVSHSEKKVDFEQLMDMYDYCSDSQAYLISVDQHENLMLFIEMMAKSSSFAHKAHKELQLLTN